MLSKSMPLLFSKCWHFFSKKNCFHSGLLEAVHKVVQEKGGCSPSPGAAHEDDTSAVPVLTQDESIQD